MNEDEFHLIRSMINWLENDSKGVTFYDIRYRNVGFESIMANDPNVLDDIDIRSIINQISYDYRSKNNMIMTRKDQLLNELRKIVDLF